MRTNLGIFVWSSALIYTSNASAIASLRTIDTAGDALMHECNFDGEIRLANPLSIEKDDNHYSYGFQMHTAMRMVIDRVNSQCGIEIDGKNKSVSLYTIGDDSEESHVREIGQYLVNRTDFLLGPYSSDLTAELAPIAEANGRVMIAAGSSRTSVYRGREYAFGTLNAASKFFANALEALNEVGAKTIAIIQEDGSSTCNGVATYAQQHGMTIEKEYQIESDDTATQLGEILPALAESKEDVLIACTYETACIDLIRTLRNINYTPKAIVLASCFALEEFRSSVGQDSAFLLGASPWDKSMNVKDELVAWSAREFNDLFVEETRTFPGYQAASAAGSTSALLQAIRESQSLNSSVVKDVLQTSSYLTVYGEVAFDENNQRRAAPILLQYSNTSEPAAVWPVAYASTSLLYPLPTWGYRDCYFGSQCSGHGTCGDDGECICHVGFKPKKDKCIPDVQENRNQDNGIKVVCRLLFAVNIIFALVCLSWTLANKRSHVVRASQTSFLLFIVLGAILSSTTILMLTIDDAEDELGLAYQGEYGPASTACQLSVWFYTTGFVFTFAPLFAKIYRVGKIMEGSKKLVRVKVSMRQMALVITAVLMVDWAIVLFWKANDPLYFERTVTREDQYGNIVESVGRCTSKNPEPFIIAIFLWHLIVLLFGVAICYRARQLSSLLSEGKYVTIAMVSNLQVVCLATPILVIVSDQPIVSMFLRAGVVALNDFGVLVFLFIPKIIAWRSNVDLNSIFASNSASSTTKVATTAASFNLKN